MIVEEKRQLMMDITIRKQAIVLIDIFVIQKYNGGKEEQVCQRRDVQRQM